MCEESRLKYLADQMINRSTHRPRVREELPRVCRREVTVPFAAVSLMWMWMLMLMFMMLMMILMTMTLGRAVCPVRNKTVNSCNRNVTLTVASFKAVCLCVGVCVWLFECLVLLMMMMTLGLAVCPLRCKTDESCYRDVTLTVASLKADASTQELSARWHWACPLWDMELSRGLRRARLRSSLLAVEHGRPVQRGCALKHLASLARAAVACRSTAQGRLKKAHVGSFASHFLALPPWRGRSLLSPGSFPDSSATSLSRSVKWSFARLSK